MGKFVLSRLSQDNIYNDARSSKDGIAKKTREVKVNGRSGISRGATATPLGVVTEVTDDQAAFLEEHPVFKLQKGKGHVAIVDKIVNPDRQAEKDLDPDAGGAQKTPKDVENDAKKVAEETKGDQTLNVTTNAKPPAKK